MMQKNFLGWVSLRGGSLSTKNIRKEFTEHIQNNWKSEYHDFRIKEDGEYWSWDMQDAWEIWKACYKFYKEMK